MNSSTRSVLLLAALAASSTSAVVAAPSATMCAKGDQAAFSCPLSGGTKTVSLCVAGDLGRGSGRFYYAYGRDATKPELMYPAPGGAGEFTRSHLTFGGNSGGYAYAFTNAGFKYVVYSVSGSNGLQDGGLVVQKDGQEKPVKQVTCQAGKVTDTDDEALIDATLKWKSDATIEKNGVPGR